MDSSKRTGDETSSHEDKGRDNKRIKKSCDNTDAQDVDASTVLATVDYTLLKETAEASDLVAFAAKAKTTPPPAALCVFSYHINTLRPNLKPGTVVASVVGGFPVGYALSELTKFETELRQAVQDGTDEIDVVLEPELGVGEDAKKMLGAIRNASSPAKLKVILESSMRDEENLRLASRLALESGAEFIKTSTGRRGGCTDEAARIMAEEIVAFEKVSGEKRCLKLSGGIRTLADARRLMGVVRSVDPAILSAGRFRIGASSLLDGLLAYLPNNTTSIFTAAITTDPSMQESNY